MSDLSKNYVFLKDKFVEEKDAVISVRTHAFLYGTSVFEGIRGYWNENSNELYLFKLKEHYQRMHNSAKIMHMNPQYSVDEMCEITVELMKKNNHKENTYIRPTLYKSSKAIGPGLQDKEDTFLIFTTPLGDYVDTTKGLNVCVSNWRRLDDNSIPPRAKVSGAYANTALVISDAKKSGFDDAIVLSADGKVTEGSAMNLYLVKDGKLYTSKETDNILVGITRDTVKTIAKDELGVDVIEREINRTELYVADEAFYCGTGAQVSPIISIDNRLIGSGEVGKISKKIQNIYFDVVKGNNKKYSNWCTPVYGNN